MGLCNLPVERDWGLPLWWEELGLIPLEDRVMLKGTQSTVTKARPISVVGALTVHSDVL